MFEALVLYFAYATYQVFNPLNGVQPKAYQPQMCERIIVNENGFGVAGAKVTFYIAEKQRGRNWFPMQTRKIAEAQSGSDGRFKFPSELVYSESDGYIVYTVQAGGYGIAAGAADKLSEPNSSIVLASPGMISGQVVDESGQPIAGASVHFAILSRKTYYVEMLGCSSLPMFSTVSDGLGRFSFSNVGSNYDVDVIAVKEGMLPATSWRDLESYPDGAYHAGKTNIVLAMRAAKTRIEGMTIDQDSGKLLGNIAVDILNNDNYRLQTRYSDENGRFSFDLDPCTIEIGVYDTKANISSIDRRKITCAKGQVVKADMHVRRMGEIVWSGTAAGVKDANEFKVFLEYETGRKFQLTMTSSEWGMTTTIAHGKFKVLDVVRHGYRKIAGPNEIIVQADKTTYANFVFEAAGITGRVHDKVGNGIGGVELYIVPGKFPIIQSNMDGFFSIPAEYLGEGNNYSYGPKRLIVANDNEKNLGAIIPLEVKNNSIDITIMPGCIIEGRIVDEANAPVAEADVWFTYDPIIDGQFAGHFDVVPRGDFKTDDQGRFSFAGICKGTYQVYAGKPGYDNGTTGTCWVSEEIDGSFNLSGVKIKHRLTASKKNEIKIPDILITKVDKTIQGRVWRTDGRPIAEAIIRKGNSQNGEILAKTDKAGYFSFGNVGNNEFEVGIEYNDQIIEHAEMSAQRKTNNVIIDSAEQATKPTASDGLVEVTVRNAATKETIKGAYVTFLGDGFVNWPRVSTAYDGIARALMPPGECRISVGISDYSHSDEKIQIVAGQTSQIEIELTRSITLSITGKVLDVNGNPVKNSKICSIPLGGTSSGINGDFRFIRQEKDVKKEEPIWICARNEDGSGIITQLESWPSEPVILRSKPGVRITGRVIDPNGINKPKHRFSIILVAQPEKRQYYICEAVSDESGIYQIVLPRLPEGFNYYIGRKEITAADMAEKDSVECDLVLEKRVVMDPARMAEMKKRHEEMMQRMKERRAKQAANQ